MSQLRRALTLALIVIIGLATTPAGAQTEQADADELPPAHRLLVAQRNALLDEIEALDTDPEPVRSIAGAQARAAHRRDLMDQLAEVEAEAAVSFEYGDSTFEYPFAVYPVEIVDEFVNSWGSARSGGRRHKGTDILAPRGVELYAIEDGYIDRTSNSALGGIGLYFQGDSGARYFYAHLDSLGPQVDGERVRAGDVIGTNGDTGNARGTPHLHIQWAPEGGEGWRNPYPMLETIWDNERPPPAIELDLELGEELEP